MLAWPAGATVSAALSSQLHCLAEPALLKALVQQALPLPSSGLAIDNVQQAGTVGSLCQMLQAVAAVSALCQKALIFTAGPADFVKRLWTSYLQVDLMLWPPCFAFVPSLDLWLMHNTRKISCPFEQVASVVAISFSVAASVADPALYSMLNPVFAISFLQASCQHSDVAPVCGLVRAIIKTVITKPTLMLTHMHSALLQQPARCSYNKATRFLGFAGSLGT